MSWTCRYCGKDTSDIDYDYLDGYDHLSCALENIKMKTKLKITNPEKINSKNICLDKSIVEINYVGLNAAVNTDNETYTLYKFAGIMNSSFGSNTIFEIHTDIKDNKVQFNIWKNGGVELNKLPVNVIRDRSELINRMIAEVKKS